MILKHLLNTRMKWMIFIKIWKNKIQIKNEINSLYLIKRLLIHLVIEQLIPIVTQLFIIGEEN